jgi:membrane-associated HD superfamily phosphohydrolase
MEPLSSAAAIIKHVNDGVSLAKKYRLPPRIQDFIREHHGSLLTRYQYTNALKLSGSDPLGVNAELFRYPGPSPRSKETILLMLADGVEAKARAEHPKDEKEIRALVTKVFEYIQKERQLDQTSMTFNDLNRTYESFVKTLQNTYHPRILYPELNPPTEQFEQMPGQL